MKKPEFSLESIEPFFEKISKLSQLQRALISGGIFLILNENLKGLEKELKAAKKNAKDLKQYQKRMKAAESRFKLVMKSLPEKEEIPSLLSNVSRSGQDAGLEFVLFQPKKEIRKDFYAEIPVAIKVTGKYHNVALFFDKVARLPRVVNIRNIKEKIKKEKKINDHVQTSHHIVRYSLDHRRAILFVRMRKEI
jgi:type IV pilus assembly protein PilO